MYVFAYSNSGMLIAKRVKETKFSVCEVTFNMKFSSNTTKGYNQWMHKSLWCEDAWVCFVNDKSQHAKHQLRYKH